MSDIEDLHGGLFRAVLRGADGCYGLAATGGHGSARQVAADALRYAPEIADWDTRVSAYEAAVEALAELTAETYTGRDLRVAVAVLSGVEAFRTAAMELDPEPGPDSAYDLIEAAQDLAAIHGDVELADAVHTLAKVLFPAVDLASVPGVLAVAA